MVHSPQRWTSASVQPAENGGFVAYGDHLEAVRAAVAAERERCAAWIEMADGNRDQREHAAKLAAMLRKA